MTSAAAGVIIGMALSMGISHVGCRVWEKRPGSQDLVFNELMIWVDPAAVPVGVLIGPLGGV